MRKLLTIFLLLSGTALAQTPSQFANLKKCAITGCLQNSASGSGCYLTVNTTYTADSDCTAYASPNDTIPSVYDGTAGTIYTDPTFGTQIKRIGPGIGAGSCTAGAYAPKYASVQSWSLNGDNLMLNGPSGFSYLFNGNDPYTCVRKINVSNDGADELWMMWSNSNDNWLINTNGSTVRKVDVSMADAITTLTVTATAASNNDTNFNVMCDTSSNCLTLSTCEMGTVCVIKPYQYCGVSDDDTKFAGKIIASSTGDVYGFGLFQYNLTNNTVQLNWFHKLTTPGDLVNTNAPQNSRPKSACISPDGDYVIVTWNTDNTFTHYGTEQYKASDGTFVARNGPNNTIGGEEDSHPDVGRLAGGTEAWFAAYCGGTGEPQLHNDYRRWLGAQLAPANNSSCTPPTDAQSVWVPDTSLFSSWHLSARNTIGSNNIMNGWALLSSYNAVVAAVDQSPQVPMGSEIFAMHFDGSDETRRIAHAQSCPAEGAGGVGYYGEPHATPNRTFTKVIWGSTWRDCSNTAAINTFLVELPLVGLVPGRQPRL